MPGPGPKLPRMDAAAPKQPQIQIQQPYKPSLFDKLIEGAMFGAGAYLAVRLIRHFDTDAPTDRNALNP